MAWDKLHKVVDASTGKVECTLGYMSEQITLGDNADSSTSYIPGPINSDMTILAVFNADLGADTYVQVEHSVDNSTWIKQGEFEEDATVDHDDISKNMAKLAGIDESLTSEDDGLMMLYDLDSHGTGMYTRITVKANGTNESTKTCTFYLIPHF